MSAELVGRRVVLRRRAGERDGRPLFTDILGELVESAAELVVRRADGSTVAVPAGEVHRLKAVPPARPEVVALEVVAARGWPAPETEWLGEWLLRAGQGWTRRANSALLLGDPGLPLPEALDRVKAWYAERGLPARLVVPLPAFAPVDHVAEELGWPADVDVDVLTAPVVPTPLDPEVRLSGTPGPEWEAAYAARTVPAVGRRILTAPDTVTFGSIADGSAVVAIGRGVVLDGWLGISAMEVAPEYRRRGLAHRMLRGLLSWGATAGAERCYIQVEATNPNALSLYRKAGFTPHHRCRNRASSP